MKRLFFVLVSCLLVISGCGSNGSEDVFVATGNSNAGLATTSGRVVFNFTRPQTLSVPASTVQLDFQFLSGTVVVISERRTYEDQIVFENVPSNVTSVEVTAIDADGFPLLFGTGPIEIDPNEDFVVTLTSEPITLSELVVSPSSLVFEVPGETQQLSLQGRFSNGFISSLDADRATYSGFDTNVVTVDGNGLVTSGGFGTTSIIASFEFGGATVDSDPIPVTRSPISLAISDAANTFDTSTGELNGTLIDGWDGEILNVLDFSLPVGSTLTVTGDQPLQLAATGNILVEGIVDASGGDGEATGINFPAGLGGTAGPGGFPGGRGGGFNVSDSNGENGFGPGGGGGGMVDAGDSDGFAGGSGGGAGHLMNGTAGTGFSFGVGGVAGLLYESLPTILRGGSGGGGGSIESDSPDGLEDGDDGGAGGGGGGGAVRMTAQGTIEVSGTIDCSGGDGGDANDSGNGTAGGAGSGGAIELLASLVPTVSGTLNVDGGFGGVDALESVGGDGSPGRTNVGTL